MIIYKITFIDGLEHTANVNIDHEKTFFNDIKENGIILKVGFNTGSWRPFHMIKQIDWKISQCSLT